MQRHRAYVFGFHYYSEISQTEKDKYCMISLICVILKTKQMNKQQNRNKVIDTENKQVITRGEGNK